MDINRNIYPVLKRELVGSKITLLTGSRQVGKTYLLNLLKEEAIKHNLKVKYFNMELPADLNCFSQSEVKIFDMLVQYDVVFIDEFYLLKNASHILKAVYDSDYTVKVFISGSSNIEIHKHLKESMAGRYFTYSILPCSLDEWEQVYANNAIEKACRYGLLPELVWFDNESEKYKLLENIVKTYLEKDIKALIKEENIIAFNRLLYLIAEHQGQILNIAYLAREIRLSEATVVHYLELMKATYVLHVIPSYSTKLGNELKKSKKYYLYDNGIRNMLLKDFRSLKERPDGGAVFESFVLLELLQNKKPNVDIRFWRSRTQKEHEVDFIWIKNRMPFPIEVKLTWKNSSIPKSLKAYLNKYTATSKAFVISQNKQDSISYKNTEVMFLSFNDIADIEEYIEN